MDRLPLALIGCGMMGARHLRGYGELERTAPGQLELVAVCDGDRARAESVANEAEQLLGRRPRVLATVDEVLRLPGLAAVDVVTPNRTHDAVAVPLLEAGLDLLLEKPFAVTIARGRRILAAAGDRVLAVAENNRRDPMQRLLRHAVRAGLLGDITFVQQVGVSRGGQVTATPWRHHLAEGGLPLDVWIHLAYSLENLAGPWLSVAATGTLVQAERSWTPAGGEQQTVACEGIDALTATLELEAGGLGSWATHFASPGWSRHERVLVGTEATAVASPDRSGRPVTVERGGETLSGDDLVAALPDFALPEIEARLFGERPGSYSLESAETDRKLIAAEVADFLAAVRLRRRPEVPGELGLRSVALVHALLESAHAGRPVTVAEVLDGDLADYQATIEQAGV